MFTYGSCSFKLKEILNCISQFHVTVRYRNSSSFAKCSMQIYQVHYIYPVLALSAISVFESVYTMCTLFHQPQGSTEFTFEIKELRQKEIRSNWSNSSWIGQAIDLNIRQTQVKIIKVKNSIFPENGSLSCLCTVGQIDSVQ